MPALRRAGVGVRRFDPSDPRRQPWDGRWPREADAERLGFFIDGDRTLPDINRLFAECRWNPEAHDPTRNG
jgi:hypothetical protein